MPKKLDIEMVRERVKKMGYTLVDEEYKTIVDKSTIKDNEGFLYHTKLDNLFGGRVPEKFRHTNIYTIQNIKLLLEKSGTGTELLSEKYKNAHDKLLFRCGRCGEEYSTSFNHVHSRGQLVCQDCSRIEKGINHRVPPERVNNVFQKSGLKMLEEYQGDDKPVLCEDKEGRLVRVTFKALVLRGKDGYFPYYARHSRYESMIMTYLETMGVPYVTQYTFEDCINKRVLPFDFAVFPKNAPMFLIEADGEQHFVKVLFKGQPYRDWEQTFIDIKTRDGIKDKYCHDNCIPLLRIPFTDFQSGKYIDIINNQINNLQNIAV